MPGVELKRYRVIRQCVCPPDNMGWGCCCAKPERAVPDPEGDMALVPYQPDHFVVFDDKGWFIEHSLDCRVAGTIGTCEFNEAIREIADDGDYDPDQHGRWRITNVDSEGLPSLEKVP